MPMSQAKSSPRSTPSSSPNPARAPLLSLDEALQRLLGQVATLADSESVATFEADRRVLAADLVSGLQVPPNDNSSMDGYAVRRSDVTEAGVVLPVSQRIAAGHPAGPLRPVPVRASSPARRYPKAPTRW